MNSYSNNLKYKRIEISFPLRSFFGKYPLLFYFLYGLLPKNRMLSVNRNTQLVIEGFPRSANTFAVVALQNAQSVKLQLAHHMHVPAQVIRGVHWNIPTIVLIRNPKDAIVSLVINDPRISITQALKCYISFYEKIYPYRPNYIVAPFKEVINNYSSIIQKTNNKFKTNFISPISTDSNPKETFQKIESIEKIESIRQGAKGYSESQISRPSLTRTLMAREQIQKLEQPQYIKLLKIADEIYSEFLS